MHATMKWFRRRGGPAVADQEPATRAPHSHPSPALSELLRTTPFSGREPSRRLHVIDLGPALGENISFLAESFPCSVEVVDLFASLPAMAGTDPEGSISRALPVDGEPADLVLAWDVLNYLSKEQFRAAGRRLAQRCRPGATLFAMIVTAPVMHHRPGSYALQWAKAEGGRGGTGAGQPLESSIELLYRHEGNDGRRAAPRYRAAEVDAMLPGFSVRRSMLLRHGIQEFLLRRDAEPDAG